MSTTNNTKSIFSGLTQDMIDMNEAQGQTAFVEFHKIAFSYRNISRKNAGLPEDAPRGSVLGLFRICAENTEQDGHAYIAHLSVTMPAREMLLSNEKVTIRAAKSATARTFDAYLVTDKQADTLVGVLVDTNSRAIYRLVRAEQFDLSYVTQDVDVSSEAPAAKSSKKAAKSSK